MPSFRKPPVLRVIAGGRRTTTEEEFKQALKENAAALVEIMKARLATNLELKAKQQRLLQKLSGDSASAANSKSRRRLAFVPRAPTTDVLISDQGSIVLVTPQTNLARQWIRANIVSEASEWCGPSLVVEHRFIARVVDGMRSDGLRVR